MASVWPMLSQEGRALHQEALRVAEAVVSVVDKAVRLTAVMVVVAKAGGVMAKVAKGGHLLAVMAQGRQIAFLQAGPCGQDALQEDAVADHPASGDMTECRRIRYQFHLAAHVKELQAPSRFPCDVLTFLLMSPKQRYVDCEDTDLNLTTARGMHGCQKTTQVDASLVEDHQTAVAWAMATALHMAAQPRQVSMVLGQIGAAERQARLLRERRRV